MLTRLKTNSKLIRSIVKALVGYAFVYGVIALLLSHFEITVPIVQEYFAQFGVFAVLVFLMAILLVAMTPLPDSPVVSAGVLILGVPLGFVTIWSGLALAAVLNFFVAKKLGRNTLQKYYPQISEYMDIYAERSGIESIIVGRAFSFFTFDIVSFAAGLTKIKFSKYFLASMIGLLPVTINYTIIGAGIASQSLTGVVLAGVVSLSVAVLLGLGARILKLSAQK